MLTESQASKIKEQLLSQIEESNLPNKEEIISSLNEMNSDEFEEFLKQNNLIKNDGECIFCSIASGKIPSQKISENSEAIAVLEINPVSEGHVIVIPKSHSEEVSNGTIDLAKETAEHVKILKPKKIDILPSKMFGHEILNIIPVYKDENLDSSRKKTSQESLKKTQEKLTKKTKAKAEEKSKHEEPGKESKPVEKPKEKEILSEKNYWLPKRFP